MSILSMEGEKPVSYWGNISPDMAVRFGQTLIELAEKHQSSTSDPSVKVLELVDSLRRSRGMPVDSLWVNFRDILYAGRRRGGR